MIANSRILITGGTGSLGKALIDFFLTSKSYRPDLIKVLSRDENKQYWLDLKYKNHKYYSRLKFIIGDIRSQSSLLQAMQDIDIVIHAAAMKQVPVCEKNPHQATLTNVLGSQNIVTAILNNKIPIKKVIGISTDKACNPINVYGMTKFIQERIFISANDENTSTDFIIVRYGNVLGSRGSVIELFQEQIRNSSTISLTDPNMTRFFFSIEDAISTILVAINLGKKKEIIIPKIKSYSIKNIATILNKNRSLPIVLTGIREGEKLHETLISRSEIEKTRIINFENKKYYIISPYTIQTDKLNMIEYTSENNINTLEETEELLMHNNIL